MSKNSMTSRLKHWWRGCLPNVITDMNEVMPGVVDITYLCECGHRSMWTARVYDPESMATLSATAAHFKAGRLKELRREQT